MTKNKLVTIITVSVLSVTIIGLSIGWGVTCANNKKTTWHAPMLSLTIDADYVTTGTFATNRLFGTYDAQKYNASTLTLAAGDFTSGQYNAAAIAARPITKESLLANNAVKMNAKLDYKGAETYNAQFRVNIYEITWNTFRTGSITRANAKPLDVNADDEYENGAAIPLYRGSATPTNANHLKGATDPTRWYFDRLSFVSGTDAVATQAIEVPTGTQVLANSDWDHPDLLWGSTTAPNAGANDVRVLHNRTVNAENNWFDIRTTRLGHTAATGGTVLPGTTNGTYTINKDTISYYADTELYFIGLKPGRYVISYFMEVPDWEGHVHRYNIVAYTSTVITVTDGVNSGWHIDNAADWVNRPTTVTYA